MLNPGQILVNRYRVERMLGQGGFGVVYVAQDLSFHTMVAVKENSETLPDMQQQFQAEASILRMLDHPNLPKVYDYFVEPTGRAYIVMQYISGEDLRVLVHREGAMSEPRALTYMDQILGVVEYLHDQNPPIIHRGISPNDIVVGQSDKAYLVDFGIAKASNKREDHRAIQAIRTGYSPPEQYGRGTDARSDIYALGATLYFLLTSQDPPEAVERATEAKLVPPRQLNPSISNQTESAILRALELDPRLRWQTVGDMRLALRGQTPMQVVPSWPKIQVPAPLFITDIVEQKIYEIENTQTAKEIAAIGEQGEWLPREMIYDPGYRLEIIHEIAQRVRAAMVSETLYNKQTRWREALLQTQRTLSELSKSSLPFAGRLYASLIHWADVCDFQLAELQKLETIPNVYVAGSPLATASKVFKGRHDLFVALERELASHAETRPTLLLFGARRSGKTSAIKQMPVRLGPDVIPVEVDLQSAATAEDARGLLFVIADQIKRNALTHRRVQLPLLTRDDLRADPYVVFGDWLNRVEDAVGTRWILLNLDEYEKLAQMIDDGRIDARVFDFLRGIIQHHPRVTVLLSGSHTLEDVGAFNQTPLLSNYLINVRVLKIENLKEDEARELIVQPIEDFPLEYEPAAVERILAVTGCQPFLVQATCRDLVNLVNEQNRTTATLSDADRALDSVLTTGVAYFQDLWGGRDSDDAQRAVMRAIATQKDVGAFHETPLQAALRKLVHRDILAATDGAYRFRVELVRRWVERNAS
jgi:serine/threonine protein kinase